MACSKQEINSNYKARQHKVDMTEDKRAIIYQIISPFFITNIFGDFLGVYIQYVSTLQLRFDKVNN
jgi:hypothetical protein